MLRETALAHAIATRREFDKPADVVKAAQVYLDFLSGKSAPAEKPAKVKKR